MKTIIALGLATALVGATPAFAGSGSSALCGPNGPEEYKRPGGYCEQLDKNSSLAGPGTAPYEGPSEIQVEVPYEVV